MMTKLISFLMISVSMNMILSTSPLAMGLNIILLSTIITSLIAVFSVSWLAMAIFIIYIGGLLVLFAYFLAIQPNTHIFYLKSSLKSSIMALSMMLMIENMTFKNLSKTVLSMTAIMLKPNFTLIILIALILLLILVVVASLGMVAKAPLRPFK